MMPLLGPHTVPLMSLAPAALGGAIACVVLGRSRLWRARRATGGPNAGRKTVVIVGGEAACSALIARIRALPRAGFQPLCLFDETGASTPFVSGVAVCPGFDELARMVHRLRVNEIWLALPLSQESAIRRFVNEFRHDFVNIRFMPEVDNAAPRQTAALQMPDIGSLPLCNHAVVQLLGAPAINLAASRESGLSMLPKRIFDRLFAALVLICLAPLLIGIAIAVKWSSPGPVFFTQKRMGVDGREFRIFKFRSMRAHACAPGQLAQATRADPRVTRVGAFLRRTSLDELPQFINVLLGNMSVVGPRPHALEHDALYRDQVDGYMYRYRIKPGITGWAQVNGYRGETDRIEKMRARIAFDLYYIQNWDFWLDIKIVLATLWGGFRGPGAY